jgi:class 3 adenylate cyclase
MSGLRLRLPAGVRLLPEMWHAGAAGGCTRRGSRGRRAIGSSARAGAHRCGADRRLVTVLFGDLSGFTRLGERLDPEEIRALQGELFEEMASVIKRYDGFVEKFVGDAVMAVFGAPAAHEDDPERARRRKTARCPSARPASSSRTSTSRSSGSSGRSSRRSGRASFEQVVLCNRRKAVACACSSSSPREALSDNSASAGRGAICSASQTSPSERGRSASSGKSLRSWATSTAG